jgi:general secretion pathway protein D
VHSASHLLLALLLAGSAFAADQAPGPCVATGSTPCASAHEPSPQELKQAREAFRRGLKLDAGAKPLQAFGAFEEAARLAPRNPEYLSAREITRQKLVYEHLESGNAHLLAGKQVEALAEFRSALHLDPGNDFALQRLRDALGDWKPASTGPLRVLADAGEIEAQPNRENHEFRFVGDSRFLLQQVATAYGLTARVDDAVASRRVRFDIGPVDFAKAMDAAGDVTKTFWAPLSEKEIAVLPETPENHRQYDRMALRSFYIPDAITPQALNDITNLLRVLFEIRYVNQNPRSSSLTVRAPRRMLDAATELLEHLSSDRPQVLLDIKLFEVDHNFVRQMGLNLPAQFNLFNIPAGALAALGGRNIQDLINQLIAGGGINQANSAGLAGLLAQLQNQSSSIFSQPLATFGGGLTLMGLSIPKVSATLSRNESWLQSLQHVNLHAAQGDAATFKVGQRYPILNASFAPIFNTPSLAKVIQNGSFTAPFPSFNYEDLGLVLKAKPFVQGTEFVRLDLEVQIRNLAGQSINGVPVIGDREYKGSITVRNGEQAVVAGQVTNSETRLLTGIPGVAQVPLLNKATAANDKETSNNEILLVITPHVLSAPTPERTEVWLIGR